MSPEINEYVRVKATEEIGKIVEIMGPCRLGTGPRTTEVYVVKVDAHYYHYVVDAFERITLPEELFEI